MDLLEQPIEAVAFHVYSLPEVAAAGAAAWTCLAAVLAAAAAAGVWRLRYSTPAAFTEAAKPLALDTSPSSMSPELERSSEPTSSSPAPSPSPKERYTAYYQDIGCVGCCDVDSDEEDEEVDPEDDEGVYGPSETDPSPFPLEREIVGPPLVLLMPTATPDELVRHRSPRELSGSVVRLWDQGAEWGLTAASPRRRGRAAGTVSIF